MQFIYTVNIPLGVFGTGQLFLETMKTETVVDTLAENAARFVFPLQDQNGINPVFPRCNRSGKSGRTGADYKDINMPFIHDPMPPSERNQENLQGDSRRRRFL